MKKLFNRVYYAKAYLGSNLFTYYHACPPRAPRGRPINSHGIIGITGTCSVCKTYILSYKKLKTISGLKELTE